MKRFFKDFTIAVTGTAQPLLATTATAAIPSSPNAQTIPVADSSLFIRGDRLRLDPTGANPEAVFVQNIVDGTHIQISPTTYAHNTGSIVQLATACKSVYVQFLNTAGIMYLGGQTLNVGTKTGIQNQAAISATQPYEWSDTDQSGGNMYDPADFWISGTNPDTYRVTLTVY